MSEEKRPFRKAIYFDTVQIDKQWRRRCQQEEINMLDCYGGPKAKSKNRVFTERNQHFHSNGARIVFSK